MYFYALSVPTTGFGTEARQIIKINTKEWI